MITNDQVSGAPSALTEDLGKGVRIERDLMGFFFLLGRDKQGGGRLREEVAVLPRRGIGRKDQNSNH
jgi:hypothetical protein